MQRNEESLQSFGDSIKRTYIWIAPVQNVPENAKGVESLIKLIIIGKLSKPKKYKWWGWGGQRSLARFNLTKSTPKPCYN